MYKRTSLQSAIWSFASRAKRASLSTLIVAAWSLSASHATAQNQIQRATGDVILTAASFCPAGTRQAHGGTVINTALNNNTVTAAHFNTNYNGSPWGNSVTLPDLHGTKPHTAPSKLPIEGLRYCVVTDGTASSSDAAPFIGEIKLFATRFCPQGWADANGQQIDVNQYQMLYSLVGASSPPELLRGHFPRFVLPDLSGKEPASGLRYCIALDGEYPQRP